MVIEVRAVSRATPILRQVVSLNDGNRRLIMPVPKGSCARDALPHTVNIDVCKYGRKTSATWKHIYNESANLIDNFNVAFVT